MAPKSIRNEPDSGLTGLLERARLRARSASVPFAGLVFPSEAWELFNKGGATIVDVRTAEERKFVGRVPESLHVAWKTWPGMVQNDRFVEEVEAIVPNSTVLLLLCRSGVRSAAAAEALTQAGYENAFNILEGFEGELDEQQQRGKGSGWRHAGLPWMQD